LSKGSGKRDGYALPRIGKIAASNGQTTKAMEHYVAFTAQEPAHEHVAKLMKQNGYKNAGYPDQQVLKS
jgi:hypothetical protein